MMKKLYLLLILISLITSCNSPKLNGHYHVEWGNISSFQTWNIENNRMRINKPVCSEIDSSCFNSKIYFKGDSIYIEPWVDIYVRRKYYVDKKGIINLEGNPVLQLIPNQNCLFSDTYFNQKTKKQLVNFNLLSNSMMYGESVFPEKHENELIIGKSKEEKAIYIFNDKLLTFNVETKNYNLEKPSNGNDLWIHVDERMQLNEITPILKEIHKKGYQIFFSSKERTENDEQVRVLEKSIVSMQEKNDSYLITSCEYCEKHPTKKIDSILKFKIFNMDSCLVEHKITDFFQLRNHTVRFLKQNRTTRLNTQIQIEINSNILFKDYLELMTEIDFVNTELLGTYYRDSTDIDFKEILNKQYRRNSKDLHLEFPLRIQEIIKPF